MLKANIKKGIWLNFWIIKVPALKPLLCDLPFLLQVKRTYSRGTYRAGAMRQVSLVGAVDEEVGDYFPEFLSMLEESPFLMVSAFSLLAGGYSDCDVSTCVWPPPAHVPVLRNLKFPILCLCSELCRGEPSPACGFRARQRATTAPSCGSDPENRWSRWQTCPNPPSKGKGLPNFHTVTCYSSSLVTVLNSSEHKKGSFVKHRHVELFFQHLFKCYFMRICVIILTTASK